MRKMNRPSSSESLVPHEAYFISQPTPTKTLVTGAECWRMSSVGPPLKPEGLGAAAWSAPECTYNEVPLASRHRGCRVLFQN